jgi:hypothetical protein
MPIVLSAVIVFVASSIMHMLLKYHQTDYHQLPDEDKLLSALRPANLKPGLYIFPFCTHKDMKSPALAEKYKQGPVGFLSIRPNGPPSMPTFLGLWFAYCLIIGFFVAYLAAHTIALGAHYLEVFRVAGTAAFLAYGLANLSNGIWKVRPGQRLSKKWIDGLVYALCWTWHLRLAVAAVDKVRRASACEKKSASIEMDWDVLRPSGMHRV